MINEKEPALGFYNAVIPLKWYTVQQYWYQKWSHNTLVMKHD